MSSADRAALAAEHLARAQEALEVEDFTAAVLWAYACAEVAVDCLAEQHDLDPRKEHFRRASMARRLFETGVLEQDVADLLIRLNNERKHATYEGLQPDLRGRTWEEVVDSLGGLVAAATQAQAERETPEATG